MSAIGEVLSDIKGLTDFECTEILYGILGRFSGRESFGELDGAIVEDINTVVKNVKGRD